MRNTLNKIVCGPTMILLSVMALSGCDERIVTHSERITMEVVAVHLHSKTNSKVDLRVVGQPVVYHNQRLSCSKSRAQNVVIGSKWEVLVEDFRYGDRYGSELMGTSAICDLSN